MNVRDVMTAPATSVTVEAPLKDVARLLIDRGISGVPVVDGAGHVVGVISEGDFLRKEAVGGDEHRTLWARLRGRHDDADLAVATTVRDLMTSPATTVEADRSLHAAAAIMARRSINRLPVVEDGLLVGIVTRADIVRAFARSDEELAGAVAQAVHAVDGIRSIEVRDGIAVLRGTVGNAGIAASVRDVVAAIEGVVTVDVSGLAWPEAAEVSDTERWAARQDYRQ